MIKLNDLEVYKISLKLSSKIWDIVHIWAHFERDTLGKQFVRASDSIALNLAEGFGRYHYKENKQFCYYSRGSAFESATCLELANRRGLLNAEDYKELRSLFIHFFKLINGYIKSIGSSNENQLVKEDDEIYKSKEDDKDLNSLLSNDSMTNDQ